MSKVTISIRNKKQLIFSLLFKDQTSQDNTAHDRDSYQSSSSASALHEESNEGDDSDIK
ncbi:uncharacterized protein RHIMIDRAFT_278305 [Rhizopus microsporus ATCC 52813]|uniref:Uncharacterized protein n=1 Tax=Rhizopus microsporus ATCC 52813 TaxID=1340429 RepID=A0A2G4SZF7_RHIZD|nr:uncharacterized protein RHIMIDRAFT_278305 [Rhizopus microsporus ATCC 52813]PHZ14149.1 hypothetical protein RHIMIDRAFT_278305 [Rhizopus microsporus ATCC 52813]